MLNHCEFIGNVGKAPEVRHTQCGQAVANFSVGVTEKWTDKDGQRQERTEWVRVQAWGKTAEIVGQYVDKGRQVYVSGRMQTREWTDKDNQKRYTTEIIADRVLMLGKRDGAAPSAPAPASHGSSSRYPPPASAPLTRDEMSFGRPDDEPF